MEVPFPTLDSCRSAEHWFGGNVTGNAQASVQAASDGREGAVLALSGSGSVSWSSQIALGPPCSTLRHDPWTIDPDPEDESVDMRVTEGSVSSASVVARLVRGGCGNATLYDEGVPGSDWTRVAGRSSPVGCA